MSGDSAALAEFRRRAEGDGGYGKVPFDFERFVPAPEGLSGEALDHWQRENWQTKWNLAPHRLDLQTDEPGRFVLLFETAWGPPVPVVRAASEAFPTLVFELVYDDFGEPFAGRHVFQRGEVEREDWIIDDDGKCIAFLEQVGWREEAEWWREELRADEGREYV